MPRRSASARSYERAATRRSRRARTAAGGRVAYQRATRSAARNCRRAEAQVQALGRREQPRRCGRRRRAGARACRRAGAGGGDERARWRRRAGAGVRARGLLPRREHRRSWSWMAMVREQGRPDGVEHEPDAGGQAAAVVAAQAGRRVASPCTDRGRALPAELQRRGRSPLATVGGRAAHAGKQGGALGRHGERSR